MILYVDTSALVKLYALRKLIEGRLRFRPEGRGVVLGQRRRAYFVPKRRSPASPSPGTI